MTPLNSQENIGQCSSSSIDDNPIINKRKKIKNQDFNFSVSELIEPHLNDLIDKDYTFNQVDTISAKQSAV
ncbi:hypothetical protein A3Q56_08751, partial [Intoshia linei]